MNVINYIFGRITQAYIKFLKCFLGAFFILLGLFALLNFVNKRFSLPINQEALDNIKSGTTQNEILVEFGPPYEVVEMYGKTMWKYYSPPSIKMVYLQFDDKMKYESYEVDD
jgi:outer membrane protein assembly factor BamE (lipoprotein component of BamABCDE complex)